MNLQLKVLMNINAKDFYNTNNDHLEKIGTMKRPIFSLHHWIFQDSSHPPQF